MSTRQIAHKERNYFFFSNMSVNREVERSEKAWFLLKVEVVLMKLEFLPPDQILLHDSFVLYFYHYIIDANLCATNNNCICFVSKGSKFNQTSYD